MSGPKIGFDYRIHLGDMDMAAQIWLKEGRLTPARLQPEMGHIAGFGSRKKAITVLSRLWSRPVWQEGLGRELLRDLLVHDHRVAYWGLLMVAYPFAAHGASDIGRLLMIQDELTTRHVNLAIVRRLGESEKVRLATRKLLITFSDWNMLAHPNRGVYTAPLCRPIKNALAIAFLTYCALVVEDTTRLTLSDIEHLPWLFPFKVNISPRDFDNFPAFSVERNGPHELKVGVVH
ncbi:MAG: hypothetical protein C7B46_07790 [Sulfobacillus benefaciens]|uniref:DUF1819 domain-containing protein n=1 Tax=Sulfobacillus benefaciens TaxID=453960 RepID=A0A2T2XH94_9FIRM|nr:MAG: hypothetical protein C7B46_07790 [Sulfobacillus benefaciens]